MPYYDLIPDEIECIHLALDVPIENEQSVSEDMLSYLHYAPIGVAGIRERTAALTSFFRDNYPMLLIVDVSVEITLLARLSGIPTIVVKQHGNRSDLPHRQAYESAELLLAPFSAALAPPFEEEWIHAKTVYTGGFSRYSTTKADSSATEEIGNVGILIGKGGTSIDSDFIKFLASSCPDYTFHIIGNVSDDRDSHADNVKWHGNLADPLQVLAYCAVVIGNGGQNTVMEMADLNKRFICIPEERPFEEQRQKAELLAHNASVRVIQPADLTIANWPEELAAAQNQRPDWGVITDAAALENIANAIKETVKRIFKK